MGHVVGDLEPEPLLEGVGRLEGVLHQVGARKYDDPGDDFGGTRHRAVAARFFLRLAVGFSVLECLSSSGMVLLASVRSQGLRPSRPSVSVMARSTRVLTAPGSSGSEMPTTTRARAMLIAKPRDITFNWGALRVSRPEWHVSEEHGREHGGRYLDSRKEEETHL